MSPEDVRAHIDTECKLIQQGPVSHIYRTKWTFDDGRDSIWVAVKAATVNPKFSKEPHDIKKEVRILSSLSHENVISILGQHHNPNLSSLRYFMPSVPYLLADLLASPLLSPYTLGEQDVPTKAAQFNVLAKSLIYQIISAVSYLHSESIAHRDIKPHNLLITDHGCVKLIDFGIAWKSCEDMADKTDDLWPEPPDRMYFEVATGPYRAPELLFGTRCYDANATDLWSLGATLAEFLTPLRLRISDPDDDDDDDDEEDDESEYPLEEEQANARPFITPDLSRITNPKLRWSRETLFDASRGEIGLAWSIFKIRGTPTAENWPTFANLPHSSRVTFNVVPPVDLSLLLPNCPTTAKVEVDSTAGHFPTAKMIPSPLDLVYRFLVYPEQTRLKASEALLHPWFTTDPPVLLPKGYPTVPTFSTAFWEGKTLGEWLIMTLPPAAASP